ncbi:MAG: ABC transporter ATP-binding protein [Bdellovibrionaceae bacterium]|nr:ABC transporter ATP-binding protein [Pseudobdellovibrionaceae bacterium]
MAIVGEKVIKEFGNPPTRVLHALDFRIDDGEFISISGRSGSGKSTLLYIISTLDKPTQGRVLIDGRDPSLMTTAEIHRFRNTSVGFIFQFHYLLPELSALENVLLGPRNMSIWKEKRAYAMELLDTFGVADQAHKLPAQMSGGQQQRVAIARALVMNPKYIFADEPTGNLDTINGERVMGILLDINKRLKTTICLVTHEPDYAKLANREIFLSDGHIVSTADPGESAPMTTPS